MANEGDQVRAGDIVAEIETDKSIATVEAERDGVVLKVLCSTDDHIGVGSVMMWLGAHAGDPIPESSDRAGAALSAATEPTAKARALLNQHGLAASQVPASGVRLSAADVEAYISQSGTRADSSRAAWSTLPEGEAQPLTMEERAMIHVVTWQKDNAVPAYVEVEYDSAPWDARAAAFMAEHRLMMSPLLPLLAHRLVELARRSDKLNATIVDGARYCFRHVALGFTVQAREILYLVVVREAETLDAVRFVARLGELQRRALSRQLRPEESQGATIGFSSMARWNVSRHMPILPPHTAVMVAHAATRRGGTAVLGATYDHRVLTGFEVCRLLNQMTDAGDATAGRAPEGEK